ncbi:MAG: hypothetical protein V3R54_07375, partial [Thermodesulfovibrionia bacterium]
RSPITTFEDKLRLPRIPIRGEDDVWIPAYRRQARWSLPSNFVIGGEYDNNSDSLDTFARGSIN